MDFQQNVAYHKSTLMNQLHNWQFCLISELTVSDKYFIAANKTTHSASVDRSEYQSTESNKPPGIPLPLMNL